MSIPVLILGKSGTGKTTSLRYLNPDKVILIQNVKKPLPFKSTKWLPWNGKDKTGSIYVSDKANHIIKCIGAAEENGKEIVIVDDFQYQMSNQLMRRVKEKGWEKFNDIAHDVWAIVQAAIECKSNTRVYFLTHTSEDEYGENIKMKTIGKMLDDKICMEGLFTIVLRSMVSDGNYVFSTQNSGSDTVKSPMGMFESMDIDNNLKNIDEVICEYYGI